MVPKKILLYFSLTCIFFSFNQLSSQTNEWKTYNVSNTNNGLMNDDVRAIVVSGDDVWFGTYGGGLSLLKKSTEEWKVYNTGNSNILSNYVSALAVDGNDLWIGTDMGISRFNMLTHVWTAYDSITCVSSIAFNWKFAWFGTMGNGIIQFEKSTYNMTILNTANSQLPDNNVTSIQINGDYLWCGTNGGVAIYNHADQTWNVITASGDGIQSNTVHTIALDGNNAWFGHDPGSMSGGQYTETHLNIFPETDCLPGFLLSSLNVKFPGGTNSSISSYHMMNDNWQHFELSEPGPDTLRHEKNCFAVLSSAVGDDYTWFGTVSRGIFIYQKSTGVRINYNATNSGLAGDLVWAIACDEMYVWLGTFKKGVSRYKRPTALWKTWRQNNGLVNEYVEDIDVLGDEAWFATHRGVSCLKISTEEWTNYTPFNSDISGLYSCAIGVDTNNVWIGPTLEVFDKKKLKWNSVNEALSLFSGSSVWSIEVDNENIWFGFEHGKIGCYFKPSDTWSLYDSSVTNFQGLIGSIETDEDAVWFGCLGEGVGYFNKTTGTWLKFNTTNSGLADDNVTSLTIDHDNTWISTYGGGISRFHKSTDTWETFNSGNTAIIFLDNLWTIANDGNYLWCGSHSQGLYRYEKLTGLWENFNTLNSPLVSRRVYDIEVADGYMWACTYDPYGEEIGSVNRYGDTSPPVLLHNPVKEPQPSAQRVLILASIEDNVGVSASYIHYRLAGSADYKAVSLEKISGDSWIGQIPAVDVLPGIMEYYLSASDNRNITTHPYSSASNSPYQFYIYDNVPPQASVSISSASTYVTNNATLNVSLTIDGTGSDPTLEKTILVQYDGSENVVESTGIALDISWEEKNNHTYELLATFNTGILADSTVIIRLKAVIHDDGHSETGDPFIEFALSNPLFKFIGGGTSIALITEPDSMEVLTGLITIKGTATDENFKSYEVSYLDSVNSGEIIQSSALEKENTVLALWDTDGLKEGKYLISLEVKNADNEITSAFMPVILDTTPPLCQILNIEDNMITGGQISIIGTATDKHFKEYYLEYGEGVNPVQWTTIEGVSTQPVHNEIVASWNTLGMNGYYSIQLHVIDHAGLESHDTRIIVLDNQDIYAKILEPASGEIISDAVSIRGTVTDVNFKQYTLEYISAADDDQWKCIHTDSQQVQNGILATWDTNNLNGTFWLRLVAEDLNNHIRGDSVKLIIDNLAPRVNIADPMNMSQIGGVVPIYGTAYDENLAEYVLEWCRDSEPVIWTKVTDTRFLSSVLDGKLGEWNTPGKTGVYSLKLTVTDKVNHTATTQVQVEIIDEIKALSGGCIHSPDDKAELCLFSNALNDNLLVTINQESADKFHDTPHTSLLSHVYKIMPMDLMLAKPGILKIGMDTDKISDVENLRKVVIAQFSLPDSQWISIGGTGNPGNNEISSPVYCLGYFALVEDKKTTRKPGVSKLTILPRIFSPLKGEEVHIMFQLGKESKLNIKMFNLAGRIVRTLCDNEYIGQGHNTITWEGKDSRGQYCMSGIYIVVVQTEEMTSTDTVVILNN